MINEVLQRLPTKNQAVSRSDIRRDEVKRILLFCHVPSIARLQGAYARIE